MERARIVVILAALAILQSACAQDRAATAIDWRPAPAHEPQSTPSRSDEAENAADDHGTERPGSKAAGHGALHDHRTRAKAPRSRAVVARVIDGDTIEVRLRDHRFSVRLIGVDTPETVAPGQPVGCYGPEASAFTQRALEGEHVRLEFDEERRDRYGRVLAYVWVRGGLFNRALVRRGLATVATYPPNDRYEHRLLASQRRAHNAGRGLWGACRSTERPSQPGTQRPRPGGTCGSAYAGACIPPYPPDLDCSDLGGGAFRSVGSDPHGLDGDRDGIACEA